jgi:alpha-tubulin suppressor-like RCC1 family protein
MASNYVWSFTTAPTGIAVAVDAGDHHTVALKSDGTVRTWGDNAYGQLGDNTTTDRTTPVQVLGLGGSGYLTGVSSVASGWYHTIALKGDGAVWTWGRGGSGQLGDNAATDRTTPVQVLGPGGSGFLTSVKAIAGGGFHTIVLKNDSTVWAWGQNTFGRLGDGTSTQRNTPVQVVGPGGTGFLTDVKAIGGGLSHTVALKSDGTVWTWGYNSDGQLGDNTVTARTTPVQVKGPGGVGFLTDVKAIASGVNHTIAVKTDGTVWAWGDNAYGQLGDNATTDRTTPVQVSGLTGVVAVTGGRSHSIALKSDGTVWTWGANNTGQLGDGTNTQRTTPVQVVGLGGAGFLTGVSAVASGLGDHTVTVKTDGTVWSWGYGFNGELGNGVIANSTTPVQASGL